MDIKEIPSRVFNQLSTEFGIKEEKYDVRVGSCSCQDWKIQKITTGHFIAYAEVKNSEAWQYNVFAIWKLHNIKEIRSGTRINHYERLILIEITAGSFPTGSWGSGLGRGIKEDIHIRIPINGIFIGWPIIEIMCEAVSEANALAMSPNCVRTSFHENDKEPGEYTHSSF